MSEIRKKRLLGAAAAALLLGTFALCFIYPYGASAIIRAFKARFDVYFMYGSTAGKAIFLPLLTALCLPLMTLNVGSIATHDRIRRVALWTIVFTSVAVWFIAFHFVGQTLDHYEVTPGLDGAHFQFCEDGRFYTEFVSLEHTHSLKSVASHLLLRDRQYHTGEDYLRLYAFPLGLPTILMVLALFTFFVSLPAYREVPLVDAFSYVAGFYMTFFSYFDGGVLNGAPGLFFLVLPELRRVRPRATLLTLYFAAACLLGLGAYRLFFVLDGREFEFSRHAEGLQYFAVSAAWHRLMLLFLFFALTLEARRTRLAFAGFALGIYATSWQAWWLNSQYNTHVAEGEVMLVQMHSTADPPSEDVLLRAKNLSLYRTRATETQSAWDYCQKALSESEGLSYHSIMVVVYCQVLARGETLPAARGTSTFVPLEFGSCGYECSPELEKLFRVQKLTERRWLMEGLRGARDFGVASCLANVKKLVSKSGSNAH